ncbi:pyruvate kinase [Archaeoglobales archaeon ex4484_92]|nr:MAG: pyruvate kinase [Archaeoglobales archaeon ex4484_92]
MGPSSRHKGAIEKMIKAGMSVARINFSHGTLEEHAKTIELIRKPAEKLEKRVAILGDLPGLKMRVGKIKGDSVTLKKGDKVMLTTKEVEGDKTTIPVEYKAFPKLVSKGDVIYLSDGYIGLKVDKVGKDEVECLVTNGGILFSHKGINIPKANLPIEAVTPRDFDIIEFAIEQEIDAIGLSFVGSVYDVLKVKSFLEKKKGNAFVIAKIERPDAVRNFDEILNAADGIMVARGDLGVEMPIEKLPIMQKQLIKKANLAAKPVITATQMLVSMTTERIPKRAEVTDVANAILDGTDAVMLSEETAIGKYPVESVEMMAKIVKYILTPTRTGLTPRLISRFKPKQWILAFSNNERVCNSLTFSYGVYPFCMEEEFSEKDIIMLVKELGIAKEDDTVLLTEGKPIGKTAGTNTMRIFQIP